jgi:hypothetical protein
MAGDWTGSKEAIIFSLRETKHYPYQFMAVKTWGRVYFML